MQIGTFLDFLFFNNISKSAEHPYLWEHSHRRLHVEKIGCRKFALILEKPEIDENLPTPLSWDAKLRSTRQPIESSDFPKDGFRRGIKRGFWKVSAHLVESSPVSFCQTRPENDEKMMKIMKNRKSQNRSGIMVRSFPEL